MIHRRHITALLATLILGAAAIGANAQTAFDRALEQMVNGNLNLRASALRSEAETETLRAENTLSGPEAEFSRVWGHPADAGNKWSFSVSQGFDWPGVYAARREAARTATTAAQFLNESALLDARREAGQMLLDLIYLNQLTEVQTTLAARADEMVEIYRKGAEDGSNTRLDYNKAVLERIGVHGELHTLEGRRETLLAQMSEFCGGEDISEIAKSVGNVYPEAAIPPVMTAETLRQRDPAYAAAMARVDAAKSMLKVERRMALPGFSVGYVHEKELGARFDGFSIGISLPSYGRRHQSKAAVLEAEAAALDAEMALATASSTLAAEGRRAALLRHILDEYEPVVNDSSNIRLLTKALNAGQINYLTFIQECNYFLDAYRAYLDTLYEYHSTIWRLRRYE